MIPPQLSYCAYGLDKPIGFIRKSDRLHKFIAKKRSHLQLSLGRSLV
ncbi:hypothetical protein GNF10_03465 [Nostoc sp. UCD121]|nr:MULTISPECIES: hypothetical protein [unclassified Nostoc]MBC1223876.1 hypothetical protein [Nostoc sp. UCD120]MBC1275060.1 hypothetical protein [Nostoc sp. UCD121]MBC1293762.1 hypothetical protein [Nostoc sp. UCD122]